MSPLQACHRCSRRQRECHGPCLCTANGRDIRENAKSGTCPLDKFPPSSATCSRCWSPAHSVDACPIPPDHTEAKATSGGCGCDGSQTRDAGDRPKS